MSQNLAQLRAGHALGKIQSLDGADYGNYVSFVKALPATIIMAGLGQALAMEKAGASKDGDVGAGHKRLYEHMNDWLCGGRTGGPYEDGGDVLQQITQNSDDDYVRAQAGYVRAQAEAMAYLEWLKKFAVAFLNKPAAGGGE